MLVVSGGLRGDGFGSCCVGSGCALGRVKWQRRIATIIAKTEAQNTMFGSIQGRKMCRKRSTSADAVRRRARSQLVKRNTTRDVVPAVLALLVVMVA